MTGTEQTYSYLRPSAVTFADGRTDVLLATSGGVTSAGAAAHPAFFDGFLGHPEQTAAALLAVGKVARTRFYTPPGMVAAIPDAIGAAKGLRFRPVDLRTAQVVQPIGVEFARPTLSWRIEGGNGVLQSAYRVQTYKAPFDQAIGATNSASQ